MGGKTGFTSTQKAEEPFLHARSETRKSRCRNLIEHHVVSLQIGCSSGVQLNRGFFFFQDLDGVWATWNDMKLRGVQPTRITLGCMVEAAYTSVEAPGGSHGSRRWMAIWMFLFCFAELSMFHHGLITGRLPLLTGFLRRPWPPTTIRKALIRSSSRRSPTPTPRPGRKVKS